MLLSLLWPAGEEGQSPLEHTHLGVHEAGLHVKEGNHGEGRLGVQSGRDRAWCDHYPTSLCRQQYTPHHYTTLHSLDLILTPHYTPHHSSHHILTPHYTPHHTTFSHHALTLHHAHPPQTYLPPCVHNGVSLVAHHFVVPLPGINVQWLPHCSHTDRQTDKLSPSLSTVSGPALPLPSPPPAHCCPEHAVRSDCTSSRTHPQSSTACE